MILALDTATPVCSVVVARADGTLLACWENYEPLGHAANLTVMAEGILQQLGLGFQQLSAVACAAGPGSYTGLRIGASAAKGYAMALDIPLLGIPTLQAMARRVQPTATQLGATILPMMDARRMEVYTAQYTSGLTETQPMRALLLETELDEFLPEGPIVYVGDGVAKGAALFPERAVLVPTANGFAAEIAQLASVRLAQSDVDEVHAFVPEYLKPVRITKKKKTRE